MFSRHSSYEGTEDMVSSSSLTQDTETTSMSETTNATAWLSNEVFLERGPAPGIGQKAEPATTVRESTTPGSTNSRTHPGDTMPVACVTGENTKESAVPEDGVCDYLVFAHVTLDESNSHFVDTGRHEGAFEAFLRAARLSSATQFLLSVSQRNSADFASQLGDEARASRVLSRYRTTRIRGYGFAHYDLRDTEPDRKQLKKLHSLLKKVRHLDGGEELVVFMGVRFILEPATRPNRLKELMKNISKSITFLVIITHVTPSSQVGPAPCVVEPITSWTNSSFNNHSHLSLTEAAELVRRQTGDAQRHQSFLLSSSMAVVYYNIEGDTGSNAQLKDVPCTGASVSSYATVCKTEMGWKLGAEGVGDHVCYEQFFEVGKWRTYKTRPHLAADMRAALDMQLGFRREGLGWAFYDVDLDDGEGRCARTWKVRSVHEARFFRLKDAAANFREFKSEFHHTATRYRFR